MGRSCVFQRRAARLHWELADFDACLQSVARGFEARDLDKARRAELEYLGARALHALARIPAARAAAERGLALAKESLPKLADDLRLLLARLLLGERRHEDAFKGFRALITDENPRLSKAATWSCISAINGETTTVVPGSSAAGS